MGFESRMLHLKTQYLCGFADSAFSKGTKQGTRNFKKPSIYADLQGDTGKVLHEKERRSLSRMAQKNIYLQQTRTLANNFSASWQ